MDSVSGLGIPQIALIVIVIAILLIGIMMITNTTFDIWTPEWVRRRIESRRVDKESFTFWPSSEYVPFTGLIVPENKAPVSVNSDVYTMSVEMIWYNTRILGDKTTSPYRHILHRGSGELKSQSLQVPLFATPSSCRGAQFGSLPPQGLPSQMNPGIFADPIINDLYVFITTTKNFKQTHEKVHIPDVPLNKPFHLTVILQKKLVEVYINCQLQVSKILEGQPIPVSKGWYGLSGRANLMAQIQNLKLWRKGLSPYELNDRCPPITFAAKRPVCPSMLEDNENLQKAFSKNGENTTVGDLGYGNSLSRCPPTG